MRSTFLEARELLRGVASRSDRIFVISKGKALLGRGVAHTSLIGVNQGQWADVFNTVWDSSAIAVARSPTPKVVLVGEDGDVATWGAKGEEAESIQPTPIAIRNAQTIDGLVYACGMKRQVFCRVDEGVWRDMSAPMVSATDSAGFEDIDGYSGHEIYAAGWKGEVWQYGGTNWTSHGSLTSVILTSVCCAPDGLVYIAGQQGVMLRGRNAVWELVRWNEPATVDFWDLCWFQDSLYVATTTGMFRLSGNDLIAVDFGAAGPLTCYNLSTAEGVLWSIGHQDVASFDGTRWRRYD